MIGFVDAQYKLFDRPLFVQTLQNFGDALVFLGRFDAAIDQPQHHIGIGDRLLSHADHMLAQFVFGFVDTGCIEEDDLYIRLGVNTEQSVTRGLRFGAGDGDLLTEQAVKERRFAHVGAANHGDIA